MNSTLFSAYVQGYDQLQPLRVEMYEFYHELALDMVPFDTEDEFRMLELAPVCKSDVEPLKWNRNPGPELR